MSQDTFPLSDIHPDSSGLQVTSSRSSNRPVPYSTLEVAPDDGKIYSGYYGSRPSGDTKYASTMPMDGETINTENATTPPEVVAATSPDPKYHRRTYIIIGAAVAIIICLAAILGGVLGSRAKNANSEQTTQPSSSPTVVPTVAPTAIAPKSRLAAAAWQAQGGFTRLLFYQDSNGTLRTSLAAGSGSVDEASWESPKALPNQFPVKNLTSITTSILSQYRNNNPAVQLEMFYLNESSCINGINYVRALGFETDGINENKEKFQAMDGSGLAAYWPYIVFQSLEGVLQIVSYPWGWKDLNIHAKRKSRLALVPTSRNYTEVHDHGRWAIIYQSEDGKLMVLEDPLQQGANKTYPHQGDNSRWDSGFPDIKSDSLPPIAAFSVASSTGASSTEVSTFVLYQDTSGTIQQVWRDGIENEWKTSTPSVFKGADQESSIACATTPMWLELGGLSERLLEPASNLTQCFFMKNGSVMETQLDGTDWKPSREVKMDDFV